MTSRPSAERASGRFALIAAREGADLLRLASVLVAQIETELARGFGGFSPALARRRRTARAPQHTRDDARRPRWAVSRWAEAVPPEIDTRLGRGTAAGLT